MIRKLSQNSPELKCLKLYLNIVDAKKDVPFVDSYYLSSSSHGRR